MIPILWARAGYSSTVLLRAPEYLAAIVEFAVEWGRGTKSMKSVNWNRIWYILVTLFYGEKFYHTIL